MTRVPLALLGAGIAVALLGIAVLAFTIAEYVGNPLAVSSTSGRSVFTDGDGGFVSYDYFQPGPGVSLITTGGVLTFASLFLLAMLWRPRRR
ncbi:hypothetical protein QMG83_01675 [Salinibacterium sp. G-O1]|uniref:hypothetical protein n=1 Tax=Salinibacterium sp. G-O1 TaxID=3046208 RepID=UPI0024BB2455|nr:hypothetical protein [Salinibacterium sp. G-O1]MDJ0333925.1 hypothetical protein [Salinibacterium sp. G-O1]